MRSLFSRVAALSVMAVSVAGCAGSNGTALPPGGPFTGSGGAQGNIVSNSTGTAAVRFVNGSPDAGAIDLCVDGSIVVANSAYKAVSTFYTTLAGAVAHSLTVYVHSAANVANGACSGTILKTASGIPQVTSFTPASNVRTTVVLAGTKAASTLSLVTAAAPALNLSTPIGPGGLFIAASPANAALAFGSFNATTGIGAAASSASVAYKATAALTVPAYAASAGVAYYVATTAAATTPTASLYAGAVPAVAVPSAAQANAADAADTSDVQPYVPKNDYFLTVVAVDGAAGTPPQLIGAYDPITLGY